MPDHDFRGPSVDAFLEALAGAGSTPGGGSAAAVAGAMGASLVRMLSLLTVGREAYANHERLMQAVAEQAAEEQQTLLDLAAEDAAAFDAVLAALALPKETGEQEQARTQALQEALVGACEVPFKVMERCLEVIGLARNAVTRGNRNAASDGAAGSELARAALKIAASNVQANLASIADAAYVDRANARMDEMLYMGVNAANAVDAFVRDLYTKSEADA